MSEVFKVSLLTFRFLFPCFFYFQVNQSNFDLVMESDAGTFSPVALQFAGSAAAQKVGLFSFFSIAIFIQVLKLKIIPRNIHYSIKHERNPVQHFASEL